jgi:hypothetical protein
MVEAGAKIMPAPERASSDYSGEPIVGAEAIACHQPVTIDYCCGHGGIARDGMCLLVLGCIGPVPLAGGLWLSRHMALLFTYAAVCELIAPSRFL